MALFVGLTGIACHCYLYFWLNYICNICHVIIKHYCIKLQEPLWIVYLRYLYYAKINSSAIFLQKEYWFAFIMVIRAIEVYISYIYYGDFIGKYLNVYSHHYSTTCQVSEQMYWSELSHLIVGY